MKIKNIANKIVFSEFYNYSNIEFRCIACSDKLYSNINFINCFQTNGIWFWFDIIRYSTIDIITLFKGYNKYLMNDKLKKSISGIVNNEMNRQLFLNSTQFKRMKEYLDEYENNCK